MQYQTKTSTNLRSLIPRGAQFGFVAGLLVGILLGWMFSGVVGAVLQFGFVAIALIIFLVALFFWWNVRRRPRQEGPTVYTWSSTGLPPNQDDLFRSTNMPREDRRDQDVIDLQELKEQLERERKS